MKCRISTYSMCGNACIMPHNLIEYRDLCETRWRLELQTEIVLFKKIWKWWEGPNLSNLNHTNISNWVRMNHWRADESQKIEEFWPCDYSLTDSTWLYNFFSIDFHLFLNIWDNQHLLLFPLVLLTWQTD